jgi:phosphate/sulfate permease
MNFRGFIIEFGSACTVLLACIIGYPLSTTHCQLGSVAIVGWANSRSHYATEDSLDSIHYHKDKEKINWKLLRNITIAWAVSLPISGLNNG